MGRFHGPDATPTRATTRSGGAGRSAHREDDAVGRRQGADARLGGGDELLALSFAGAPGGGRGMARCASGHFPGAGRPVVARVVPLRGERADGETGPSRCRVARGDDRSAGGRDVPLACCERRPRGLRGARGPERHLAALVEEARTGARHVPDPRNRRCTRRPPGGRAWLGAEARRERRSRRVDSSRGAPWWMPFDGPPPRSSPSR